MKKNNKMVKFTAILATALMAVSATGISTSAQGVKKMEAARTASAVKNTIRRYSKNSESTNLITLESKNAKPGEEISIPITTFTGNTCSCYNVIIEYDARLQFRGVQGAQAFCDFEQNGSKYVSVVGYTADTFKDGQAVASLTFTVPENAENDNYSIRFNEITSFSTDEADYADYAVKDAIVTVTGGAEKVIRGNCIQLCNVTGIAGDNAVVKVVPFSDSKCACYDMLIEYDPALLLEDGGVRGANSFSIFEENGRSYVSIVGYTSGSYKDGEAMATLNFVIPEDAVSGEIFNVTVAELSNFATSTDEICDVQVSNAAVTVADSYTASGLSEYVTYKVYANDGVLVSTKVGKRGDINCDGVTNVRDASMAARYCATGNRSGITDEGMFYGDVDDNGKLNIRDAAKIARFVATGKW